MTPFSKARLIIIGVISSLFFTMGIYAWYQHSQSVSKSKKIKTFTEIILVHKVDLNLTEISATAKGKIEQKKKEKIDEIDTSIGKHSTSL